MTEPEQEPGNALVLAHSGELVDLSDSRQAAKAFSEVQDLQAKLAEASRRIRDALGEHAKTIGTKTFYLDGIGKVEISKETETTFPDPLALAEHLRELGCPEETIEEIVVETISHKVDGRRAARAASVNEEYGRAVENAKQIVERTPYVKITGGKN